MDQLFQRLDRITAPTLIVTGEYDLDACREVTDLMDAEIPDSRTLDLAGATHFLMIEKGEELSAAILEFLVGHITQPAFTCRLRWSPRTFVIWDNRLCVHQPFNDHDGFRREMYRTTIAGEEPT